MSTGPHDSPVRGAVLGLGMIGRHHARLLQTSPALAFAGAADPAGDRFGVVREPADLFPSLEALLDRPEGERPAFVVLAVPTEEHLAAAAVCAAAGVHVLVEKPLAATTQEAEAIIAACEANHVLGAVGHVERYNPALLELRRRVQEGQLGEVFLIATERLGPFPDRVRDVGVVKDLATHDLDLVRWIGGSPIDLLAAQTTNRTGRPHEDLVLVTGRLQSGVTFNNVVDWLTPTKTRRTRVLGDKGMLVADTLTSDLTFFENGSIPTSGWESDQALRGVTEGNSVRYALNRREPILVELEAFAAHVAGRPGPDPVVTLQEGLETVRAAETVLSSAQTGESMRVPA